MLAGQQALAGQLVMDRGGHRGVRNGRLGRGHACDQIRPVTPALIRCRDRVRVSTRGDAGVGARSIAGLGEVDFVSAPAVIAFDAVAGVEVVGGDEAVSARRETIPFGELLPPPHLLPALGNLAVELLDSDSPQCLDGGQLP